MTPQDRALVMVYSSVKDRVGMGFAQYAEAIKDYELIPLTESGKVVGGVLLKSNEIHVGCGEKLKASARRYIRQYLNKILDSYGFAITSVQAHNSVGLKFCERLGFVKVGEYNGIYSLRCDRSNYR